MRRYPAKCCWALLLLLPWPPAGTRAGLAADEGSPLPLLSRMLEKAGIRGGLIVHIGASDGRMEANLTAEGRYLVHGLAIDDTQRDRARAAILAQGRYGLASVATWRDRRRLPYPSEFATAALVDLDVLGAAAPSKGEIARIVAPDGLIAVRREGRWSTSHKPRPAGMDHWGHFDHGPDGNPVSADTLVGPIRQLRWQTGVQPNPFKGNPAGYDPGAGIRIWGRYAVMDVHDSYGRESRRNDETWVLQGRDAFNGVPLWTVPRDRDVSRKRWSLAVGDGEAYAWLRRDGLLTALDMATGKVLRTYPGTASGKEGLRDETYCLRVAGRHLVAGLRDRIVCFDRATARREWSFAREGKLLLGVVVDVAGGRVYALMARPGERREFGGRWPHSKQTESLLAVDLRSGEKLWECAAVASRDIERTDRKRTTVVRRGPGQIIAAGKWVIVFGSAAISGGESPYIASVDAATGKLAHQTDQPFRPNYNRWSYNALWRDGAAWFAGAFTNVWRFDPASGQVQQVLSHPWNQRCTRFTATPKYFLFGQAAYYRPDFSGEQVCVARSGCAMGNIPANGMTYFTPTACGCITQVRGFQAMTHLPAPEPVAEDKRLVTGPRGPGGKLVRSSAAAPSGPVADDWTKQWRAEQRETAPVRAGDLELVAVVHRHRLEARRDGKVVWRFVADGRISSSPIVQAGTAVFGSHDGYIYAIRTKDGALLWKYLLAPATRYVCVNAQLENTWPVYGVCLDDRPLPNVIASAGRHVELDGGVTVACLEPGTGRVVWRRHLQKPHSVLPPGGKGARIAAFSFINSVPRWDSGRVVLGDGGRKGGLFAFAPDESDEAIHKRLSDPKARKPK